MKILLLSRYSSLGASSRVRFFQYLPFIKSKNWQVSVAPLFPDNYLRALYSHQPRKGQVVAAYLRRIWIVLSARKYDLLWIEKEIFPFMPALVEYLLEKKIGIPYIVDYDDALFHRYDKNRSWLIRSLLGRKIDTVMRYSALVVAGNKYLAERARAAGAPRVEIIPTVVDLTRYKVVQSTSNHPLIVGWIGSPVTSHYLLALEKVYESLVREFAVRFVAIGASEEEVKGLPIEVLPWSEETEVDSIREFDIGIMPLQNSPWERGKCGYKLIQYMACGLPVVASPVGVNEEIVEHGTNGFLAQELCEWEQMLRCLLKDQELRLRMGAQGREWVKKCYSLQVQAPRLEKIICGVLR